MNFKIFLTLAAIASSVGCSSTVANRVPVGERFPTVQGTTLTEQPISLPEGVLDGDRPALLIAAYKQNAQFDVDRWLLGILQADLQVRPFEVPTVDGLVPGLIANQIDEGMRSGIPSQDWAIVITVYDDADEVIQFTGNERGLNARVMLLDADGKVVWFHDEGYSARELLELEAAVEGLQQ